MKAKYIPYTKTGNAWMRPKGFQKFLRTCILWQTIKFAYYNLKIIKVLSAGH